MQGNYLNHYNMLQYVVKKNDSLYMIAKKYNVNIDDIKRVNHLVTNMIYPNQILFIPKVNDYQNVNVIDNFKNKYMDNNSTSKVHIVTAGDTVLDIIAKYNLSLLDFIKLNEHKLLVVGTEIIIAK